MKAALLLEPEKIAIGTIGGPLPSPGEVVIRPDLVGICGTDVSFYLGHRIVPYPFVLGHEVIGRIAAVGEGAEDFSIGQRVVVEPNYPCGACRLCLSGHGAVCAAKKSMGVNVPGCLSEFVSAPAKFVWPLPDSISDQDAVTIEPLAVSMHALRKSGVRPGDTIAVLGCGVVGLLLIHAAVAAGVRTIAYDRLASKLEMAHRLGAEIPRADEDSASFWLRREVIAVFECAGASATAELALSAAPRGSQVILLGISSSPVSFFPMRIVREGINIVTSMIYDHPADFDNVIKMVAKGDLHPSCVVTNTYAFETVGEALHLAGTGAAGKIHICMA
jgi:L-iditol 2-dehydrogenase